MVGTKPTPEEAQRKFREQVEAAIPGASVVLYIDNEGYPVFASIFAPPVIIASEGSREVISNG